MASEWMNVDWFGGRSIILGIIVWIIILRIWERNGTLDKWDAGKALGFILMLRTQRGKGVLERISKPRAAWRAYGELSLWVCRVAMVLVIGLVLLSFAIALFFPPQRDPPPASELVAIPGLNPVIPLGWGALAFIVSLVIHEFGHGIQARAHGMRIRSFGILLLGPLPLGAFAEPQTEELMKAPSRERQRLFAAGPATNIFAALICLFILGLSATSFVAAVPGVHAQSLVADAGADEAGLQPYDSILMMNGTPTAILSQFSDAMLELEPGQVVPMKVKRADSGDEETISVLLGDKYQHYQDEGWTEEQLEAAGIDNGSAFLGVVSLSESTIGIDRLAGPFNPDWNGGTFSRVIYSPFHMLTVLITPFDLGGVAIHPMEEAKLTTDGILGVGVMLFIVNLLFWLIWVNILLGFTNLIPMLPFDGGHLFRDMIHDMLTKIDRIAKKMKLSKGWHPMRIEHVASKAVSFTSLFVLMMLLVTLAIPYLL